MRWLAVMGIGEVGGGTGNDEGMRARVFMVQQLLLQWEAWGSGVKRETGSELEGREAHTTHDTCRWF